MSGAVCSQCQQTAYDQMSDMHIHFMNMYGAKNIKTEHDSQRHDGIVVLSKKKGGLTS